MTEAHLRKNRSSGSDCLEASASPRLLISCWPDPPGHHRWRRLFCVRTEFKSDRLEASASPCLLISCERSAGHRSGIIPGMRRIPATLVLLGTLAPFGSAIAIAQAPSPENLPDAAVHDPQFIAAPAATFMTGDDRVIGVMSGKTAKAYPAGILAQHGL